jgi:hypothetical protein
MDARLTLGRDAVVDVEAFIYTLVVWGEHHYDGARAWSAEQMRANIPDFGEVVAETRAGFAVRYFESLLLPTFDGGASSPECQIGIRNVATGEDVVVETPAVLETATYAARFHTAVSAWRRAVERHSHAELLSALGDGIASVESFLNVNALAWNKRYPERRLTKLHKTSFADKVDVWLPAMTGASVDEPFRAHLAEMKRYRDDVAIHQKHSVAAMTLSELARLLNLFTTGIAVPLFQMHQLLRRQVPSFIVRAAFAPAASVATS